MISVSISESRSTLLIIILAIVCLMINNGNLDVSFQRHGISANRTISAKNTGSEKNPNVLKHTGNPRYSKSTDDTSVNTENENDEDKSFDNTKKSNNIKETKDISTDKTSGSKSSELKQTPNPRAQTSDKNKNIAQSSSVQVEDPNYIKSKLNIHDYTPAGMHKRYEDYTQRKEIHYQSPEARARLLNSLYSDLISENYKNDVYLRKDNSNGCEISRGRVHPVRHNDC